MDLELGRKDDRMSQLSRLPAMSNNAIVRRRNGRTQNVSSYFVSTEFISWLSVEKQLEAEWMKIQNESYKAMLKREQRTGLGEKSSNVACVQPYDETRVILTDLPLPAEEDSTFVNASYVHSKKYIAAAMPYNLCAERDFWRMIYETKVQIVVMLNKPAEKEKIPYWPSKTEKIRTYGDVVKVILREEKFDDNIYCWVRKFQVVVNKKYYVKDSPDWDYTNEELADWNVFEMMEFNERQREVFQYSVSVTHLQYDDWEDMRIPDEPEVFYQFMHFVIKLYSERKAFGPMLVHCFGGVGRTGTFLIIHITIQKMIRLGGKAINVIDLLSLIRGERAALVQTQEQYKFCYRMIMQFYESRRFFRSGVLKDIKKASQEISFHKKS